MNVQCSCGNWHRVTPTALAAVAQAFVEGDLHRVRRDEKGRVQIVPVCFLEAFTPERVTEILRRYPGHSVKVEAS